MSSILIWYNVFLSGFFLIFFKSGTNIYWENNSIPSLIVSLHGMWSICIIHYIRRGKSATSYCTCKESLISYEVCWVRPFWKHNRCLVLRETLHHWLSFLRACCHCGVVSILAWEPARGSWILGLGGFPAKGGATAAEDRGDAGAEEQGDRLNRNHNVGTDDILVSRYMMLQ